MPHERRGHSPVRRGWPAVLLCWLDRHRCVAWHGGGPGLPRRRVIRPARIGTVSFRNDVVPLLSRAGCNMGACHGNSGGKGGFRLSLRGDDPAIRLPVADARGAGPPHQSRRGGSQPRACSSRPASSPMKAESGSQRLARGQVLRAWIAAGAPDDVDRAPRLKSLRVRPEQLVLQPAARSCCTASDHGGVR